MLLVFSLAVVTLAQAQPREALHDDAWALQFSVTLNFTLAAFQGAMISAKHHMAPDRALRYGLSLNGQFENEDFIQDDNEMERDRNAQELMLSVQYIGYPGLEGGDRDLYLYMGAGPKVSFSRQSQSDGPLKQTSSTWGIAAGGLIGAEWFVRSRVSLMTEYNASLGVSGNRTSNELNDQERTTTRVFLGSDGVRFGMTLYVR